MIEIKQRCAAAEPQRGGQLRFWEFFDIIFQEAEPLVFIPVEKFRKFDYVL